MISDSRVRRPSAAPLMLAAVLCSGWVGAASSDEIALQPGTPIFTPGGTRQLFIHLANDSTRQGLQLDLTYDPRVLQAVSVAPLGRFQSPLQLFYSVPPTPQGPWRSWPTAVTLHMLAYDGSASRTSIGTGTDAVVVVGFAVRDTVPTNTAYVSVSDALAASELLVPVPIAPATIGIPLDAVTGTLVSAFFATPIEDGRVRVQWELSTAAQNLAINVYRSFAGQTERTRLNELPIVGAGPHALVDTPPALAGTLVYELFSVGPSGESRLGGLEVAWGDVPLRLALYQNAPNPFASSAVIRFDVPRPDRVRVVVYDLTGRLIRVLRDSAMPAGRYSVEWDGRTATGDQAANGIYYYRATLGNVQLVRKAVLLR